MLKKWSINSPDVEHLLEKVVGAKRELGYGWARLVIDSMSAFCLDRPVMARRWIRSSEGCRAAWERAICLKIGHLVLVSAIVEANLLRR